MGLAEAVLTRGAEVYLRAKRSLEPSLSPVGEKPLVKRGALDPQEILRSGPVIHDGITANKTRAQLDHTSSHMRLLDFAQRENLLVLDEVGVVIGVRDAEDPTVVHSSIDNYVQRISPRTRLPTRSTIFGG